MIIYKNIFDIVENIQEIYWYFFDDEDHFLNSYHKVALTHHPDIYITGSSAFIFEKLKFKPIMEQNKNIARIKGIYLYDNNMNPYPIASSIELLSPELSHDEGLFF